MYGRSNLGWVGQPRKNYNNNKTNMYIELRSKTKNIDESPGNESEATI